MATSAQLPDYQLNRIQEEGDLRTADVVSIAKDKKGFLWLATQSRVQQFDGRHTLSFSFNDVISRIITDAQDRKWVLTRGGIFLYSDDLRGFSQVPVDGRTGAAAIIYETAEGAVCALAAGKHHIFNDAQQQFVQNRSFLSNEIKDLSRYLGTYEHTLFFARGDSVVRYDQRTKQRTSLHTGNINVALPLSHDEMLVSNSRYKTFYVNLSRNEVRLLGLEKSDADAFGNNLVLYSGVRMTGMQYLVSSNKGLFQYNAATRVITRPVFYSDGRPFDNQPSITSLYKDDKGSIYMTHADGLFFLSNGLAFIQYFRNYQAGNEQLPGNDVRNFAEDEEGNIWMVSTSGIAKLNMQTGVLKAFDPLNNEGMIDYPSYRQLLNDGAYLWIGTSGKGVWLYDKQSGQCRRPAFAGGSKQHEALFNEGYVWEMLKLHNGSILTVTGNALFISDANTLLTKQVPDNAGAAISRAALQDALGRIWKGTTAGLFCYDTSFQVLFHAKDSFADKRIASFCEWKKNKMLVGSKGLFEIEVRGNKIISFSRKKGMPAEAFIYCMKQDTQGFVWMGTNDGLFRYDPLKDEAVLFDRSDHVQSQTFNSDAAFLSSTGILFMGGKNGVNYFNPQAFTPSADTLQPQLLSFAVSIDDSTCYYPDEIPYRSNNIDFIISAPEFKKPFRVRYRYRLHEEEEQWTDMGYNNHVRISKLQPGNYALQVSASYDGKTWFDGPVAATFSVLKPWWQTWWFRGLCVVAIGFTGWVLMRYRRKKREAAEMKRTIEYFTYSGSDDSSAGHILWDITRNCISRLGFEDCVIYLLDEKRNVLVQKAAYGAKSPKAFEIANPIEIPVGKGITGQVAKTGSAMIVNDTSKDERYIVDDERRSSEITVPIVHDGKVIGVIDSENRRKKFFNRHHLKTLQTISSLCASKIATALALEAAKKAENELLLLNGKMLESKFLNLRLQMNPHFLFNILTSIQYLIVSNQVNKATNYLDIFSGFLRSLLGYAEATVVTLDEELRVLSMYVELESLCLDETFVWDVQVAEEIDREDVLVPFMLLQPFVENAINHGLIHKTGEKRFNIAITEQDEDALLCIIEDNGIGRSASSAINRKNLSSVLHQSKGIGIVAKRLELLQQKTSKKACFEIEDLYKNGEAAGTRVSIIIPYYSTEEI